MLLTADEERDLMTRAKAGDQRARDRLVLAHQPLVQRIVSKIERDPARRADAVQAGFVGLLKAIDAFDPARGARLSTVAEYWIRAELLGLVTHGDGPVRCPVSPLTKRVTVNLPRLERCIQVGNPDLSASEVTARAAAELGLDLQTVHGIRAARARLSLDDPMGGDDDAATLGDRLADPAELPDELLERRQQLVNLRKLVGEASERLPPRDRDIFVERVLVDEGRYTLKDIASIYDISTERVRQIERRSLARVSEYVRNNSPHETAAA